MAEHLTGRVVAGLGDLAGRMHEYRDVYRAASGADMVVLPSATKDGEKGVS